MLSLLTLRTRALLLTNTTRFAPTTMASHVARASSFTGRGSPMRSEDWPGFWQLGRSDASYRDRVQD